MQMHSIDLRLQCSRGTDNYNEKEYKKTTWTFTLRNVCTANNCNMEVGIDLILCSAKVQDMMPESALNLIIYLKATALCAFKCNIMHLLLPWSH